MFKNHELFALDAAVEKIRESISIVNTSSSNSAGVHFFLDNFTFSVYKVVKTTCECDESGAETLLTHLLDNAFTSRHMLLIPIYLCLFLRTI